MRILVAVANAALSQAIRNTLGKAGYTVDAIEPKNMASPESAVSALTATLAGPADDAVAAANDTDGANGTVSAGTTPRTANRTTGTTDATQPATLDIAIVDSPTVIATMKTAQPSIRTLLLATTSLRRNLSGGTADNADPAANPTTTPDATLRMPFSDTELLSYVEMLARESSGAGMGTMLIRGDLTLDLKNRKAYFASTRNAMPLSRLEYDILETLVRASGRFVGLDELQHAAGGSYFTQEGLVRRGVESLDRKLRNAGLIMTKRDGQYRVL
ncbi:hypothetical protein [Bifidobacterium saguinibicoloris]|uniref:hypothetical protein n=1 Tax=Bifidobacterium saguinibicoloris TaxID=2834433 RepID=UPI001C562F41|nr:hypothetical protein [Bifidobacterium saguinibicoloris]MBW3080521.1 response regulator transcription factor [Bifidobacterium saguinibicoloris]